MTTKERPILFSAPMVLAILAGRKTMTRRIVKPQPPSIEQVTQQSGIGFSIFTDEHTPGEFRVAGPVWCVRESMGREPKWKCPYGSPGDRLWVRETWRFADEDVVGFRADDSHGEQSERVRVLAERYWNRPSGFAPMHWLPSIHMPRWASRITLQVEAVRVERVQDITEADAQIEGVDWPNPDMDIVGGKMHPTCIDAFRMLWDKINGYGSCDANPWVWVVSFSRVEVPT